MASISFGLLDEQMSDNDKTFYKALGNKIAALRKEQYVTQVQMAEMLGISQQLVAAYEAGVRKIPASLLPVLSKMFAVSVEELLGMSDKPTKRGPASTLQRQLEQVNHLPRSKQKLIIEMLDAVIQQQAKG
jgi:transcriptional regulator with XRE-family HTH domain